MSGVIDFVAWLAVGGLMGWLMSRLVRSRGREALLFNIGVGMVGALLAGWWIAPLIALPEDRLHRLPSLHAIAVTSLGAVGVLVIVNAIPFLVRRRHWR